MAPPHTYVMFKTTNLIEGQVLNLQTSVKGSLKSSKISYFNSLTQKAASKDSFFKFAFLKKF